MENLKRLAILLSVILCMLLVLGGCGSESNDKKDDDVTETDTDAKDDKQTDKRNCGEAELIESGAEYTGNATAVWEQDEHIFANLFD